MIITDNNVTPIDHEIACIDRYWRAANYITLVQMYLKENCLLKNPLTVDNIKDRLTGHWGTSPAINFIYAHISNFIRKYHYETLLVVGPGHAAASLLSNLYLEETLQKYYSLINFSEEGLKNLSRINELYHTRSEINPAIPGTIYDGGELGYSLAVAYGAILDNKNLLAVCIIGDGEAETGTISSAWNCIKFVNNNSCGIVLPIINLNGYKMGNPSIYSLMSDSELIEYFSGLGYDPVIVDDNHKDMIRKLDWVHTKITQIKKSPTNTKWPLIILKSVKGWTAIETKDYKIAGNLVAHKVPLEDIKVNENSVIFLEQWMKSYKPEELFDSKGKILLEVLEILPEEEYRLGRCKYTYGGEQYRPLDLPDVNSFKFVIETGKEQLYRNISIIDRYLVQVMKRNDNFRIMSPDELKSNGLSELKDFGNIDMEHSKIMEILNENICQAWMQGYILTGRHCLMPSYEAFLPIITSMVSQYCKYLYQTGKISWKKPVSSLNYILTSVCWTNTYSHQNPEFINSLIYKHYKFVRVYFPYDANCLLACMEECLDSKNRVNAIVTSKVPLPQYGTLSEGKQAVFDGVKIFDQYSCADMNVAQVNLVAIGDHMLNECVECINMIKQLCPSLKVRLLAVTELTCLGQSDIYEHGMSEERFQHYFGQDIPSVFVFHGYATMLKALLFDRMKSENVCCLGYKDLSDISSSGLDKMIANGVSRYDIAGSIGELLTERGILEQDEIRSLLP